MPGLEGINALPDFGTSSPDGYDGVPVWDWKTNQARKTSIAALLSTNSSQTTFLQGVPIPSLTTTQRNAIAITPTGLTIYNSTTGQFEFYNGTVWIALDNDAVQTITYATTMATNYALGNYAIITVTDNVAFTISNPTNPLNGAELTYEINNAIGGGGTLGTVTFGNAFLLAGAFVKPADTKRRTYTFRYNGTNWVEVARAAADI